MLFYMQVVAVRSVDQSSHSKEACELRPVSHVAQQWPAPSSCRQGRLLRGGESGRVHCSSQLKNFACCVHLSSLKQDLQGREGEGEGEGEVGMGRWSSTAGATETGPSRQEQVNLL